MASEFHCVIVRICYRMHQRCFHTMSCSIHTSHMSDGPLVARKWKARCCSTTWWKRELPQIVYEQRPKPSPNGAPERVQPCRERCSKKGPHPPKQCSKEGSNPLRTVLQRGSTLPGTMFEKRVHTILNARARGQPLRERCSKRDPGPPRIRELIQFITNTFNMDP